MSLFNDSRRCFRYAFVSFCLLVLASSKGLAQEHDHGSHDDHDGPIHFSHPMFTESPSPDTKLRLDYLFRQITSSSREHSMRIEAEYAFTPNVSLEANIPLTRRSESGTTANAVGSGELALKLASFAAAKRGLLFGGGVAVGVPTGNDRKAIGSSHIVEIEPYVDAGYKRGEAELVSFLSFSTTTHRRSDEAREDGISLAVSGLYHVAERVETLVELQTARAIAGDEKGRQTAAVGLGAKYHIGRVHHLVLGIAGRVPVTHDRDSEHEVLLSALWHF